MSTSKHIDKICLVAVMLAFALTVGCFLISPAEGKAFDMKYEQKLFDTSKVHTIDIIMDEPQSFLDSCESEEYSLCSVIIDGEAFRNVAIRGKGNTSLSSVASMDSSRYSFKVEFDHYSDSNSYYGLDKLSLNNLIQDNTMMKDYLVYEMMREFGAAAPLCSFAYITFNGEAFGLYLAVEAIEDSFLQRNYGNDHGNLYKPDSTGFGGGRGNGKDFNMEDMIADFPKEITASMPQMPDRTLQDAARSKPQFESASERPDNILPPGEISDMQQQTKNPRQFDGPGGGMGSEDTKLLYTDDNYDSYSNIFNHAKTDITDSDKDRLIASLKALQNKENIENIVAVEDVIRYFVVHNYAANGDSYTGSIIHNYYLYENDGTLSMLPWDYNLAFGTFQGGSSSDSVNDPIDTPMNTGASDRPMIDWILEDEAYLAMYHEYFAQFLQDVDIQSMIEHASRIIDPYVQTDPTKFCTYEEFEAAVEALKLFCEKRSQSIQGQLDGTIPSTSEGQIENPDVLIDTSDLNTSDMGSMGGMGGHGGFKQDQNEGIKIPSVQSGASAEEIAATRMPDTMKERTKPGQIPDSTPDPNVQIESVVLLLECCILLLIAIIFAQFYKRRKS